MTLRYSLPIILDTVPHIKIFNFLFLMALELRDTDTEPLCKVTMGKRERNGSSFQYSFNVMQTEEKIMNL